MQAQAQMELQRRERCTWPKPKRPNHARQYAVESDLMPKEEYSNTLSG